MSQPAQDPRYEPGGIVAPFGRAGVRRATRDRAEHAPPGEPTSAPPPPPPRAGPPSPASRARRLRASGSRWRLLLFAALARACQGEIDPITGQQSPTSGYPNYGPAPGAGAAEGGGDAGGARERGGGGNPILKKDSKGARPAQIFSCCDAQARCFIKRL